jgi:hypothetical protein
VHHSLLRSRFGFCASNRCRNWPDELHLFWQDPAGQVHSLIRRKECPIENIDDDLNGPCTFDVDCFGQGEAARISHDAQDDPLALLRYLDKFVDLDEAVAAEEAAREQLLALQTKIEEAEQKVALIPQYERALSTPQQQLKALQKPGVAELIELQRQLAAEKEVRGQILEKLQEAKEGIDGGTTKTASPRFSAGYRPLGSCLSARHVYFRRIDAPGRESDLASPTAIDGRCANTHKAPRGDDALVRGSSRSHA